MKVYSFAERRVIEKRKKAKYKTLEAVYVEGKNPFVDYLVTNERLIDKLRRRAIVTNSLGFVLKYFQLVKERPRIEKKTGEEVAQILPAADGRPTRVRGKKKRKVHRRPAKELYSLVGTIFFDIDSADDSFKDWGQRSRPCLQLCLLAWRSGEDELTSFDPIDRRMIVLKVVERIRLS